MPAANLTLPQIAAINFLDSAALTGSSLSYVNKAATDAATDLANLTAFTKTSIEAGGLTLAGNVSVGNGSSGGIITALTLTMGGSATDHGHLIINDEGDETGLEFSADNGILFVGGGANTNGAIQVGDTNGDTTVTINGSNGSVIAVTYSYAPGTPGNWNATAPTTVGDALDRLAAAFAALSPPVHP